MIFYIEDIDLLIIFDIEDEPWKCVFFEI